MTKLVKPAEVTVEVAVPDYWGGCGIVGTKYSAVYYGVSSSAQGALDDLWDIAAQDGVHLDPLVVTEMAFGEHIRPRRLRGEQKYYVCAYLA